MKPLVTVSGRPARAAMFLSGGGSNARAILAAHERRGAASPLAVACLVTDRPESGARAIAREHGGLPVVELDIRAFYRAHGSNRVSVRSPEGRRVRASWTEELRRLLEPYAVDFGIFAGFEPLTNITADFPCLNVHPGDLTWLRDGRRYLVGLHTVPVERAILAGHTHLRSSVILATPFSGDGGDMDSGPVLGLSPPVPIDLQGHAVAELAAIAARRPPSRPPGGFCDALERVAAHNQEALKREGDWVVFPPVVFLVAEGRLGVGADGILWFSPEPGAPFRAVQRLVFDGSTVLAEGQPS